VTEPASKEEAQSLRGWKGRKLGGYTILDHRDTGGMAEIFLATHERPGNFRKEIVLKLLQGRFADNPQVVSMFRDEARIGARLNHPTIVDVFDIGEEDGQHFIAMEYLEGRTLTELIRRGLEVSRPMPLSGAVYICSQVAEGLAYMNQGKDRQGNPLRVVHRDISPTNIIISDRGHTKIIDFGVATDLGDAKEEAEARPGKYSYMSPEQIKGGRLDGRSDVFSLGIMLYEITLGRRLFRGKPQEVMKRIVEDRVRPPTFINRNYPPDLEIIVMRALERDPEARYATADELGRDLDAYLAKQSERVVDRRLAEYISTIEDAASSVTTKGSRRAAAFVLEDEDVVDEEALDLNRGFGDGVAGPEPDEEHEKMGSPLGKVAAAAVPAAVAVPMAGVVAPADKVVEETVKKGGFSVALGLLFLVVGGAGGALAMWLIKR